MKIYNACMDCHGEPEPFHGDKGEILYWMVIPSQADEPTILMSDLSTRFVTCPTKDYVAQDYEHFMCIKCFQNIFNN